MPASTQTWSPEIERMWIVPPSRKLSFIGAVMPERSPSAIPRASAATGGLRSRAKRRASQSLRKAAPGIAPVRVGDDDHRGGVGVDGARDAGALLPSPRCCASGIL